MSRAWVGRPSRAAARAAALATALGLAACLLLPGCDRSRHHVRSGVEMYERASWEGALIRFRDAGEGEAQLRSRQRVRYLAYRGLTHWHLGQKEDARLYLGRAQEALGERGTDPTWLPADVREELQRASREVGVGGAPPAPVPDAAPPDGAPTPAPPSGEGTTPPAAIDGAPPPAVSPPAAGAPAPGSPPAAAPPPTVGSPSPPGAAPGAPLPPAASPPPADAL